MVIDEDTVSTAFPIGSGFGPTGANVVVGHVDSLVLFQFPSWTGSYAAFFGGYIKCTRPDGLEFSPYVLSVVDMNIPGLGLCGAIEFSQIYTILTIN
jgi:hypothetical protein